MSSEEFGLWLAYQEVQPMGPHMLMQVMAELLCAIAIGSGTKKGGGQWSPSDFIDTQRWRPAPAGGPRGPSAKEIELTFGALGGG
jgi:hypothetical protein